MSVTTQQRVSVLQPGAQVLYPSQCDKQSATEAFVSGQYNLYKVQYCKVIGQTIFVFLRSRFHMQSERIIISHSVFKPIVGCNKRFQLYDLR